jgi:peptidyl-prolyl cis-trans isomerase SurA
MGYHHLLPVVPNSMPTIPARKTLPLLAAALCLNLAGACQQTTTPAASDAPSSPDVWAAVDGREIRRDDVEKAYRRAVQPDQAPQSEDELLAVKLGIVDELITQEVLLGRATSLSLEVTDAEVDAAFAARKGNLDEQAFQDQLKNRQLSDSDLKQALRRELLADKVIEREVTSKISVTDQDVSDFYNANRAQFNVAETQYRIAQIVVTPVREPQQVNRLNSDAASPAEAQQKVQMLMDRLKGGADFAQLAADYSEDAQTAPRGGDLGFVPASALEQVQPALRNAVLQSEPGNVNLVSAGGGHTLVLLVSKETAGQRDLNTPGVRDTIKQGLEDRKAQLLHAAYVTTVRNEAAIVNYLARSIVQSQGNPPSLTPTAPGGE